VTADWSVPAGAWAYQRLAPIDAIARIAAAGGAYVQTDRETKDLYVEQRYPGAPWTWAQASPDFEIPRDVLVQRSSQKKPGTGKNAVYVHGGAVGGVYKRVLRRS
jgi:hypothetical protein